jgi:hydrogenase maturation protease
MKPAVTEMTRQHNRSAGYLLVVGYGNSLRRDDGAGATLAERLAAYWQAQGTPVRLRIVTQLTPELAADLAADGVAAIVFADAAYISADAIRIEPVSSSVASPSMGHHLDPAALLLYTALVYHRHPPAWLVSVPGVDFGYGEGFSPEVDRLLEDAPALAEQLLTEIEAGSYA